MERLHFNLDESIEPFFGFDKKALLFFNSNYYNSNYGHESTPSEAALFFQQPQKFVMSVENFADSKTKGMANSDIHYEYVDFIVKTALFHREIDLSATVGSGMSKLEETFDGAVNYALFEQKIKDVVRDTHASGRYAGVENYGVIGRNNNDISFKHLGLTNNSIFFDYVIACLFMLAKVIPDVSNLFSTNVQVHNMNDVVVPKLSEMYINSLLGLCQEDQPTDRDNIHAGNYCLASMFDYKINDGKNTNAIGVIREIVNKINSANAGNIMIDVRSHINDKFVGCTKKLAEELFMVVDIKMLHNKFREYYATDTISVRDEITKMFQTALSTLKNNKSDVRYKDCLVDIVVTKIKQIINPHARKYHSKLDSNEWTRKIIENVFIAWDKLHPKARMFYGKHLHVFGAGPILGDITSVQSVQSVPSLPKTSSYAPNENVPPIPKASSYVPVLQLNKPQLSNEMSNVINEFFMPPPPPDVLPIQQQNIPPPPPSPPSVLPIQQQNIPPPPPPRPSQLNATIWNSDAVSKLVKRRKAISGDDDGDDDNKSNDGESWDPDQSGGGKYDDIDLMPNGQFISLGHSRSNLRLNLMKNKSGSDVLFGATLPFIPVGPSGVQNIWYTSADNTIKFFKAQTDSIRKIYNDMYLNGSFAVDNIVLNLPRNYSEALNLYKNNEFSIDDLKIIYSNTNASSKNINFSSQPAISSFEEMLEDLATNQIYRKDKDGFYTLVDGKKVHLKQSSDNCAGTGLGGDNAICTKIVANCLIDGDQGDLVQCLNEMQYNNLFDVAHKELILHPESAIKILNLFKIGGKIIGDTYIVESLNEWIDRKVMKFDASTKNSILRNNNLQNYLLGVIDFVNANPVIMNEDLADKVQHVGEDKIHEIDIRMGKQLYHRPQSGTRQAKLFEGKELCRYSDYNNQLPLNFASMSKADMYTNTFRGQADNMGLFDANIPPFMVGGNSRVYEETLEKRFENNNLDAHLLLELFNSVIGDLKSAGLTIKKGDNDALLSGINKIVDTQRKLGNLYTMLRSLVNLLEFFKNSSSEHLVLPKQVSIHQIKSRQDTIAYLGKSVCDLEDYISRNVRSQNDVSNDMIKHFGTLLQALGN